MFRSLFVASSLLVLTSVSPGRADERVMALDDAALLAEFTAAMNGEHVEGVGPCLFPHAASLAARGLPLAAAAREVTREVLTYETPEGHFEIDYSTDGVAGVDPTDADESGVPDYVEWVGQAFEYSYQVEVVDLGFDFATGGRYKVRCANLGPGFYGVTLPNEAEYGRSTININHDFQEFYDTPPYDQLTNDDPDGLVRGAIRVTAAHEFKHALQLWKRWLVLNEHLGWFEVDAVWMEENVYDGVNDYYNYLNDTTSPFSRPRTSLIGNASYDDATWQVFLQQRHGVDFMKRLDARRANLRDEYFQVSYTAIAAELELDWIELWREYSLFNYLTGDRAVETYGFGEAANYPTSDVDAVPSLDSTTPLTGQLARWANAFFEYDNSTRTASGQLSFTFASSVSDGWTLTVVLQNDLRTQTVPFLLTSTEQTFTVEGYDMANFDRIALVVGNSTTSSAAIPDDYSISFALDPEVSAPPTSFGGLKSRF